MEPTITNPGRKRRTVAEIRLLLDEQEKSSCTVKEFCAARRISENNFYNWRKKYSFGQEGDGNFVSLQMNMTDTVTTPFAEIELPGKVIIRLFSKVEPSWFKALF